MEPNSSTNVNHPWSKDLSLKLGNDEDLETPSSVGSNLQAEVNANDYSPGTVPVPVPVPANVNLPLVGSKRKRGESEGMLHISEKKSEIIRWIDEHETEDVDLDHVNAVLAETSELPSGLNVPLRRYQKEFLAWALKQEQSAVRGGILADELELGKPIQVISLVLARRALDRTHSGETVGFTLLICSPTSVSDWLAMLNQVTSVGSSIKVIAYYDSTRNGNFEEFTNYDFVLTTYSTVNSEYKKMGPSADVGVDRGKSLLHSVKWNRIILDEADVIRDRTGKNAKAVFDLEATYRWALTSVPLQNDLNYLGSLVCFLQIRPYACYFCKDCGCEPPNHIGRKSLCPFCNHSGFDHIYWWKKFVATPMEIKPNRSLEVERRAKILLKHKVLKGILIRRTKRGRAADFV